MADKKISQLTNITGANLADDDEFVVVDTSVDETKAITYGELRGVVTPEDLTLDSLELAAIAESKGVTAVDVFVYDTSKDSDGGAWRKRTQHTSWYNETLNTATRGSRREFPAVAVIVAESNRITIYDGDDPALPMWMVFNTNGIFGGSGYVTCYALNGQLRCGTTAGWGAPHCNFIADYGYHQENASIRTLNAGGIAQRDVYASAGSFYDRLIVNSTVNDIAMTVLPDAPIDPATGLPVPTIAVATDGGVSVIKDDGTVVDITYSTYTGAYNVYFRDDKSLVFNNGNDIGNANWTHVFQQIPSADVSDGNGYVKGSADEFYSTNYATYAADLAYLDAPSSSPDAMALNSWGKPNGLAVIDPNPVLPSSGMIALTTSTYNTGWMNGDIKGAFLADTDDTDLVGGTDNDRSVNDNSLTVNGTVTRTPVATGAELVAYSGFSSSNYLEQPYNADLDFGTGDFCVMGWVNVAYDTWGIIVDRYTGSSGRFSLGYTPSGSGVVAEFHINGYYHQGTTLLGSTWRHVTLVRSSGVASLYVDGILDASFNRTEDVTSTTSAPLIIGKRYDNVQQADQGALLALLRISATAPTAEQIKKIYNDEKVLFQENAAATLYGTSDAVTALAHDSDTGLLHVGTSAGRSDFQGLRRVSNTTTAVGTAISASGGMVVEE